MSSNQAIVSTIVAIAGAIIAVLVAAGLPLSKNLTDAIITLITVATPAVLGLIGWLHHSRAKVIAAQTAGITPPHP